VNALRYNSSCYGLFIFPQSLYFIRVEFHAVRVVVARIVKMVQSCTLRMI
jgi:hypothetical protein